MSRTLQAVNWAEAFEHSIELPAPGSPLDRRGLPAGGGVCAVTGDGEVLVLTLTSQNLRRTLAARLQPSDDGTRRRRADIREVARHVWWTRTYSVFETYLRYLQIMRRVRPQSYRGDLAFGPVWFASVQPEETHPRWTVRPDAFTEGAVEAGPFTTRESCRRFVEMLEDAFDLCRYHDVLRQAPNGQACAYKEMGQCPAPCDGSITMDEYRRAVRASARFAVGESDDLMGQLEREMHAAAARLAFERAALLRRKMDRIGKQLADKGRLESTPGAFRCLTVQRASAGRLRPFHVDAGVLLEGDPVRVKDIEKAAIDWADKLRNGLRSNLGQTPQQRSEHIWLTSHFLHSGGRTSGLLLPSHKVNTVSELVGMVRKRFARPEKGAESRRSR